MTNGSGTWANNQPPAAAEKLWRGLALVGAFHIGGMLINVIFQMLGNNSLDGIPAKFLGLFAHQPEQSAGEPLLQAGASYWPTETHQVAQAPRQLGRDPAISH